MKRLSSLLFAFALSTPFGAFADPIVTFTTADPTSYDRLIDFDSADLQTNELVRSQFASLGLTASGTLRANACGTDSPNGTGMSGNYVGTFGPDCQLNDENDAFVLNFDETLSDLAIDAEVYDPRGDDVISLYLNGVLVYQFSPFSVPFDGLALDETATIGGREFANQSDFRLGILRIDGNGTLFDELRFQENGAGIDNSYILFDNLRFNLADGDGGGGGPGGPGNPGTPALPEPGSLALLSIGLFAVGKLRRKAEKA
jgi:hypothetical protein